MRAWYITNVNGRAKSPGADEGFVVVEEKGSRALALGW